MSNLLMVTSAAPAKSPFSTREKRPPLGVGSLLAIARRHGHQVHFLDRYLQPTPFIQEGFLQRNGIDVVGIHVNTICSRDSLRMIEELDRERERGRWKGKIIAGGPHVSVMPEAIPPGVDHLVVGEGESALMDILEGRTAPRRIQGERMRDLDSLPFQPWDLFSRLPYDATCAWLDARPVYTLNTSRGCPFGCRFCSVGSVWGREYACFGAQRIVDEIQYLVAHHHARGIYFREDNFTLNEKRTREFCELLLQKGIRIFWACETRVDNLSRELVALMARAGCRAFYLGIESGSQKILDLLNKGISVEQIVAAVTWCKASGIKTYCSLIAGIPGETYADLRKTVRLMKRLEPHEYAFNVFVGLPYSRLYQEIKADHGYEHEDDIGLLYPPGFDIKTKYFYGRDSGELVEYRFQKRTPYDRQLQAALALIGMKRMAKKIGKGAARLFRRGKP